MKAEMITEMTDGERISFVYWRLTNIPYVNFVEDYENRGDNEVLAIRFHQKHAFHVATLFSKGQAQFQRILLSSLGVDEPTELISWVTKSEILHVENICSNRKKDQQAKT